MKLDLLYEETLEAIGLRHGKDLGWKIAKAMRMDTYGAKRNQRTWNALYGKSAGLALPKVSRLATASPVPIKPRHRKFFGINPPNTPY